jgi:prophage regulatory protein
MSNPDREVDIQRINQCRRYSKNFCYLAGIGRVCSSYKGKGMTTKTQLLKLPEVLAKTKKYRTGVLTAMRKGLFPKPIRLGGRSVAWLAHEVDAWASCAEARLASLGGGRE